MGATTQIKSRRWYGVEGISAFIIALLIPSVVGVLLVVADSWIPRDQIIEGINAEIQSLRFTESNYLYSTDRVKVDVFTECGVAGINLDESRHFFERLQLNSYIGKCSVLIESIDAGEALTTSTSYYRYWFSSALVLHAGLASIGLANFSLVLFLVMLLLAKSLVPRGLRDGNISLIIYFVGLCAALFRLDTVMQSLPHAMIWVLVLGLPSISKKIWSSLFRGSAPPAKWSLRRGPIEFQVFLVCVISSGLLNLFDLLVAVSLLPVLGISIGISCYRENLEVKDPVDVSNQNNDRMHPSWWLLLISQIGMFLGYTFTWGFRWFLAGTKIGISAAFDGVLDQAERRSTGESGGYDLFLGLKSVCNSLWNHPGSLVLIGLAAFVISQSCWKDRSLYPVAVAVFSLSMTILLLEGLQDHTARHAWFIFPVLIFSPVLGALSWLSVKPSFSNEEGTDPEFSFSIANLKR